MSLPVSVFGWEKLSVEIPRESENIRILDNVSGSLKSGEIMALMGPSGSGKTTLLNLLAQRGAPPKAIVSGTIFTDSFIVTPDNIKLFSSYVEQEDSLIGSLTVKETVHFASKFQDASHDSMHSDTGAGSVGARSERVDEILSHLGLYNQRNVMVGTPLKKGISGGQKRRLSVATQIIGGPSVLFLDEPTSGLDSTAAHQVVSSIKKTAKALNMIVIISIHQPSTATFQMFDKVLFLTRGKTVYNGPLHNLYDYFKSIDSPIPDRYNPAEYILELINSDFADNKSDITVNDEENDETNSIKKVCIDTLYTEWEAKATQYSDGDEPLDINSRNLKTIKSACLNVASCAKAQLYQITILTNRLFIKSYRDVLAYYVRIVMYLGLAFLMGTVWLRLGYTQQNIQPFVNAVFFSGAFLSFMTVAYIPAYLEDLQSYRKEHMNGLYGPFAFVISNFIVGTPFIFLITLLFSIVTYFMCNFRHSATGFWYYVMWLFLDLLAAESMTIFISTLVPIFVVALALTAFANGLWMSVGGFLVSTSVLNAFWYYTFYWINYQRYVFQGMMFNQFSNTEYDCGQSCHCMYSSPLESQCKIQGDAVLTEMGYGNEDKGLWIGIMIVLIFAYRFGTYIVLKLRK